MKAIAVTPGEKGSALLREVPTPEPGPGQALVKVIRVGVDGTDDEINEGLYGQAPRGDDYLILGHESFGRIEQAHGDACGLREGDLVVATVRRPDGCPNCQAGESDMCLWGNYTERGIKGRHGYLAEYYVESPEYLIKIPPELEPVAVLLEPTSIAEKAIDQAFDAQRRLVWHPRQAVVLGAGTLGLLLTLLLRLRGLNVTTVERTSKPVPASVLAACGADYVSTRDVPVTALPDRLGNLDLIVEGTGNAQVAMEAMEILGVNGVVVLLGVSGGDQRIEVPAARINLGFVLGNKVAVGSVNARPRHFVSGVQHMLAIEDRWPGLLSQLITTRLTADEWRRAFDRPREDVKTVVEFS